jgi:hypothetical protein
MRNIPLYFHVVVGLEWSNDPESYAGGSVANGRTSHSREFKRITRSSMLGVERGAHNLTP